MSRLLGTCIAPVAWVEAVAANVQSLVATCGVSWQSATWSGTTVVHVADLDTVVFVLSFCSVLSFATALALVGLFPLLDRWAGVRIVGFSAGLPVLVLFVLQCVRTWIAPC